MHWLVRGRREIESTRSAQRSLLATDAVARGLNHVPLIRRNSFPRVRISSQIFNLRVPPPAAERPVSRAAPSDVDERHAEGRSRAYGCYARLREAARASRAIVLPLSGGITPVSRAAQRKLHEGHAVGGRVHTVVRPPTSAGMKRPSSQPGAFRRPNATDNAPPRPRLMRATLWAVAFSRLLDRRLMSPVNPRYLNARDSRSVLTPFSQSGSNAMHHPRPYSTYMRGTLQGRRVHAVVRWRRE